MLNYSVIQGRLCADPNVRTLPSGSTTCTFSIACDRPKNNKGEVISDFISCVVWGTTATFLSNYFKKGDMIIVAGRMQSRTYDDNGKRRTVHELSVNQIEFCGTKRHSDADDLELPDFI